MALRALARKPGVTVLFIRGETDGGALEYLVYDDKPAEGWRPTTVEGLQTWLAHYRLSQRGHAMATTTEAPGPNAELFVQVLAQIEKHPETWKQENWRVETECGTAYCFAGHACHFNGVEWVSPSMYIRPAFGVAPTDTWHGQRVAEVEDVAAALLGITADAAMLLFWAANDLDDLYRISADILGLAESTLREKVAAVVADGATQVGSA